MLYWLTMKCRSGCHHCMQDCKETDTDHATFENTKAFVQFYKRLKINKLLISGGEPTEHPDFEKHLLHILKNVGKKRVVIFPTNGMFLLDSEKQRAMEKLIYRHMNLFIRITNIEGLYPFYADVKEAWQRYHQRFCHQVSVVEQITGMAYIGRAKQNWSDVKRFGNYNRIAPRCFNLHSLSRVSDSFRDLMRTLTTKVENSWCAPSVMGATGDIYAGESRFCTKIGNIADMGESALMHLKKNQPCGGCFV